MIGVGGSPPAVHLPPEIIGIIPAATTILEAVEVPGQTPGAAAVGIMAVVRAVHSIPEDLAVVGIAVAALVVVVEAVQAAVVGAAATNKYPLFMKTKASFWLIGILALVNGHLFAQSYTESALLFSRSLPGGSARMQAMGGAQVSLGGDLSLAYSNPAGLAMYNRSEFALSVGNTSYQNSADYLNNRTSSNSSQVNLPFMGIVFATPREGKVVSSSFGISFNRINDFNNRIAYGGTNPNTSIIDSFIEDANGAPPTQFSGNGFNSNSLTRLAYDNFLIGDSSIFDPGFPDDKYFTDETGIPDQSETIQTSGSQNQWTFSYAANFNDKFFLGASLGLPSIRFTSEKTYREEFFRDTLNNLTLNETLEIRGSGVNLTVGAIARPVDFVQFGFSVATPTWYSLSDVYQANMSTNWNNFEYLPGTILNNESSELDPILTDYALNTPWRIRAGASFFIAKSGFITVDVERVDFGRTKYSSNTFGVDFNFDNEDIKATYRPVMNVRFGGEYRLKKYRLRAGYFLMPDPYDVQQNDTNRAWSGFTGGAGYRSDKFYVDLAATLSTGDFSYRPYTLSFAESPLMTYSVRQINAMLTVGIFFSK